MPQISNIVDWIAAWLAGQSMTPVPREITTVDLLPAAAYPQITVLAGEEEFGPGATDVTGTLDLRITHASGRPAEARATVVSLAHQVRAALHGSHGLGGRVKHLQTGAIKHGEACRHVDGGVIATAVLEVTVRYCVAAHSE